MASTRFPFARSRVGYGSFQQIKEKPMKLRRLVPLALAAYAGWKRMSPNTGLR
jgi:hypothetical protein